jgi:hypothetical protein
MLLHNAQVLQQLLHYLRKIVSGFLYAHEKAEF